MKQPTTTKTRTTTKPNEPERQPMGSHSSLKKEKSFSFRIVTPINLPLPEQFQVFYCPYFVEHLMFTQCSPRWFSSHCQYLGFFLDPRFQRQYSCHCWRITFLQQDCCNGNWLLCKSPAMQLLQQLPRLIQHCHCLTASSNFPMTELSYVPTDLCTRAVESCPADEHQKHQRGKVVTNRVDSAAHQQPWYQRSIEVPQRKRFLSQFHRKKP